MEVKDKIVIVTGGASGIGLSCVEQFLLRGAKYVAIVDQTDSRSKEMIDQFGKDRVDFYQCDVTNSEQVKAFFSKIMQKFGSFDVLVNSAGITREKFWEQMIDVNVTGLIRASLTAVDLIGKHKGGKGGAIVNIASMAGLTTVKFIPIYTGTKHAVVAFTGSMAPHYDRTGVRMLLMCPGLTQTPAVSSVHKTVWDFIDNDEFCQFFDKSPPQPVEAVSKAVVDLVERGENGAACVVNQSRVSVGDISRMQSLARHDL